MRKTRIDRVHKEYQAFLEDPNAATFRRVRSALLQLTPPASRGAELYELVELCAAEKFAEARAKINTMMPHWALSPRVHALAAEVALQLSDDEDAQLEQFIACCCLRGLLASGDGSRAFPYLVTHSSDVHEILKALQQTAQRQSFVPTNDRRYDLVQCDDGSEIWFDVTEATEARPPLAPAAQRAGKSVLT